MPRSDQAGQSPEIPGGDIQGTATDTLEQASSDLTDLKTGAADVATQVAAATAESGAGDLADGVGLDAEDALATVGLAILTFSRWRTCSSSRSAPRGACSSPSC
ncbi:hypothetical protein K3N28_16195 [Glycomyces sp. TRM65418]|uniref:hypothetical protein n=1 Tax=Glycomyces sp. TRM65418 TaxID=2867006 RepID=UPI001CE56D47|nr:hypothetical protein [Glycomyces sp. TRM65418]MCC3764600.1 hypothetical protein [Glycomyces sp. TRM65418]QZD54264.1 hypothetical protein K3N28_16110 [Glycomyces sp. TRM65418]